MLLQVATHGQKLPAAALSLRRSVVRAAVLPLPSYLTGLMIVVGVFAAAAADDEAWKAVTRHAA